MINACCCGGCDIYADAFGSDTIATEWEELAGSWSISTGILSISDASALLVANTVHPDGTSQSQVVRADIRFGLALDEARLVINYIDVDNYLFLECWIDSNGCGHFRAYERISGTSTALGSEYTCPHPMALDVWHTVSLCWIPGASSIDPGTLTMRVKTDSDVIWSRSVETSESPAGDRGGVGTGSPVDDTIDFDNFSFMYYYHETDHPTCPQCAASHDCQLNSDTFDRTNSSTLGCTWEEVAGDWEINSNELTIDEEDAILIHRTPEPDNLAQVQVKFDFRTEADVVILVILDYTDSSNFFFVQLEPGSNGDCGRVSFWRKTAGVDTQVGDDSLLAGMTADTAETHSVTVCWKDEFIKVTLSAFAFPGYGEDSHSVNSVAQVSAEPYVGLGTSTGGGTNQVWFNNFTLHRIKDADVENTSGCPECEGTNCVLHEGTTLNCYWVTEAGTWANVSGPELTDLEASTSNAMLLNQVGHPMTTGEGFLDLTSAAEVSFLTYEYGDIVRLLIGVTDDQNYLYAEWEYAVDDESTGFLRVGKVVAGVDTEIAEAASSVTGGQPNNGAEPVDTLRVCYDGFEIRANFYRSAAAVDGEATRVEGEAGIDWNPGGSGLATGTITDSVYFYAFRFYHDIFGGSATCPPCYTEAICGFCEETVASEQVDRTPPIVLVQIQGLDPDTATGCDESPQFNDTFALPFFNYQTTGTNGCEWRLRPHFCDSPTFATTGQMSQVLFGFERSTAGLPGGTFGILPYARITAYDPGGSGPSYNPKTVSWYSGTTNHAGTYSVSAIAGSSLPDYVYNDGANGDKFDCAEWLAGWFDFNVVIPGTIDLPSVVGNWLAPFGYADPSTARAKVLA